MLRSFEIITFKHVGGTSPNFLENTFYRQSTCYQTVLGFHICLKETFPNSISLGLMEYSDRSAAVFISAVFLTREHVHSTKLL